MGRYCIDVHLDAPSFLKAIREDVRRGLTGYPRSLPPKYFYDDAGSALFERITQLPEYYLTRVEGGLIDSFAAELMEQVHPQEVIELGPGSPAKIRPFLDARSDADHLKRYVPFDLDERSVHRTAATVAQSYPLLQVHGVVGDFEKHLGRLPPRMGRRLVLFLGSTIGNLDPPARHLFLAGLRQQLAPGDRLLLGVDLVKDQAILEAAYNDPGGVTAEFNRNILRVVNQAVCGDFQPEAFEHRAFYNGQAGRIEMHLAPTSLQEVHLKDLGLSLTLSPRDTIWTENSYKFTDESTVAMLAEAGLRTERWLTDRDNWFGLALAEVQ